MFWTAQLAVAGAVCALVVLLVVAVVVVMIAIVGLRVLFFVVDGSLVTCVGCAYLFPPLMLFA